MATGKVRSIEELAALRASWASEGRKVVWTNGCFDILHAGHARSFAAAKALGDILIVGINSDAGVQALKGPGRPVMTQADRAELLAALEAVDYVTVFEEPTPVQALSIIQPDIHCKGAEYAEGKRPIPEKETVLAYGGEVRFLPLYAGRSTTGVIERLSAPPLFFERAPEVKILVVGDVMLDSYISGNAGRISPEAPVPVVAVSGRKYVPGGAANVAANIRALGATAILGGVVGQDSAAAMLRTMMESTALVEDSQRQTTSKTRIMAGGQQIVRFDEEDASAISPEVEEQLKQTCAPLLPTMDACVISDYAKGVATPGFCRWLIDEAARLGKPVVVDPKSKDLSRYRGATVITPNLKEAAAAAGDSVHKQAELDQAAPHLMWQIAPSALLVTQGGDGMTLFEPGQAPYRLPAMPVEVADVTGAGDTVVAVLAIALGAGMPLTEAAGLANIAAGLAVRHLGTHAVTRDELLSQIP